MYEVKKIPYVPYLIIQDSKLYECPIYRKPARTDLNYIGSIDFESDIGPRYMFIQYVLSFTR